MFEGESGKETEAIQYILSPCTSRMILKLIFEGKNVHTACRNFIFEVKVKIMFCGNHYYKCCWSREILHLVIFLGTSAFNHLISSFPVFYPSWITVYPLVSSVWWPLENQTRSASSSKWFRRGRRVMSRSLSNSDTTSGTSPLRSDPLRREKPPVRPSGSHTTWSLAWAPWQLENVTHMSYTHKHKHTLTLKRRS